MCHNIASKNGESYCLVEKLEYITLINELFHIRRKNCGKIINAETVER